MGSDENRLTLSVKEAARKLGVARNSLYDAIRSGEVPCIRIGARILIPVSALEKLLSNAGEARQK